MKRVREGNETLHLENARRSPPLASTHFPGFPRIYLFYSRRESTKKNIYLDLETKKKELLPMVFALRASKIFLKLFYQHIPPNLSTLITTFSSFLLYIIAMPLMIGFSKDFLCHFHLGLIRIRSLFAFLPERFFQNDFEDGTLELYYLSGYCLQKISLSKLYGHRVLQISGVFRSFPVLQLPHQFDQSKMNWFTIIIGSQIFTLMRGIHSRSALGIISNGWNSLQNLTTLPTLLPLIVFCTSIETEWFHVISLMGYLLLFLFLYPILVSIIFRTLLAKRFQIILTDFRSPFGRVSCFGRP